MGRRSFVVELPAGLKAWLDQELQRRGFSDYVELAEALQRQGVKTSPSAVHRYGQQLQRQMQAIRASTEAAQAIVSAHPDDADARSGAVISLFQTGLFDAMMGLADAADMEPADKLELYGKAARGISQLTRASIAQKKWRDEVQTKLRRAKASAAQKAEAVARKAGLSDDDWGAIRAQILGIEVSE